MFNNASKFIASGDAEGHIWQHCPVQNLYKVISTTMLTEFQPTLAHHILHA